MHFIPHGTTDPRPGWISQGRVLVDQAGLEWAPAAVACVIPDEEPQRALLARLGYATHSPLTVNLDRP